MITYFRAAAIMLIVAGHSYSQAGIRIDTGLDYTLSNLIKGATALFVFISGFIFDHVYGTRYRYTVFLWNRAYRLVIPYCVLTIIGMLMFSEPLGDGFSGNTLFRNFVLGDTFQAYWYIPFIMLMYALAPLHRAFMAMRTSRQVGVVISLAILAGLAHRPIGNDHAFHSVVFYLPIYLSGILVSLNYTTLLPVLRKYGPLFVFAAAAIAITQSLDGQSDNLQKSFFRLRGFELMGLQKLMLCLGLIGIFSKLPNPPDRLIDTIANTSFAIFFLHPFVLELLGDQTYFRLTHFPWVNLVICVAAIVACCASIALILRYFVRANSKFLTGY
tara:strand:+ start:222 stop:1208 length:987 start_codon:yes stop_codon:yes gene_type:complete